MPIEATLIRQMQEDACRFWRWR